MFGTLAIASAFPRGGMTSATVFGPSIRPVGSVTCLPAVTRPRYNRETTKLRQQTEASRMAPSLILSLLCLAAWVVLTFVRPVGLGIVHVLLALGAVLWVRWWGLKEVRGE